MASSAIHSPSKLIKVTSHVKDDPDTWTALVANYSRSALAIFNKGPSKIGVGIGTTEPGSFVELKPNGIWEFLPGTVPVNYIYLSNLEAPTTAKMHVVVLSDVDEVEGYAE